LIPKPQLPWRRRPRRRNSDFQMTFPGKRQLPARGFCWINFRRTFAHPPHRYQRPRNKIKRGYTNGLSKQRAFQLWNKIVFNRGLRGEIIIVKIWAGI
jgi:hypothetical protein